MPESREQKKSQLEETINKATNAIENQLGDYKSQGKNLLVIGGILVGAFAFFKLLSDEDNESSEHSKSESSVFGSAITGMATTLLLTLAKDKLLEVLEKFNETNDTK
jgi:hypothetical protein